eukprot:11668249-Alexandrium_andersonii.AAC.1
MEEPQRRHRVPGAGVQHGLDYPSTGARGHQRHQGPRARAPEQRGKASSAQGATAPRHCPPLQVRSWRTLRPRPLGRWRLLPAQLLLPPRRP